MKRLATILLVLAMGATSLADEIDFVEDFALAKDRTVPLGQLIPGTEDYFYYHALHYQNTGQFDKVDELLKPWIKGTEYTPRVREILNRQALLKYKQDPRASLEYIREQLGIQFNHRKEVLGEKSNLPTKLDEKLIDRGTLTERALKSRRNLGGFEDSALDWLIDEPLDADRRRHFLSRLTRPDYPNLARLVVDDLDYKDSEGFGSLPIHKRLLLTQMEECLKLKPELLNESNFVYAYLAKLHPGADTDWQHDPQAREAYLDRLWSFVQRLSPVHNSLKAHALYHRLVLDRSRGIYDRERFLSYLKLPRNAAYVNADFMELDENRRHPAKLNYQFQPVTLLPRVGNDEPLIHSYLQHFFIDDETYAEFAPYIDDVYLKRALAEAKIVHGVGDPQSWCALFSAAQYKALQDRIDLDFAYTNKQVFAADEPVTLDLDVKNVRTLIVKVFEINTQNIYRQEWADVDADIKLDGLVANEEQVYTYDELPSRRVRRHFEFPSLAKPGVYVIDYIGNGRSSRALVRKGRLHHLMRTSTAGHVFTVLDETNRQLPDATIYLAGHEYQAGDDGTITVPFSTEPGKRPIVLAGGGICSLDHFQHEAEDYSLEAAMYVDRESLLSGGLARLLVRPALYVNGTPVTLSVLEDVRLVITSTDHDKVSTTREVADFRLFEDRESVYDFQVPERLQRIAFTIRARVQNLSQNKKVDVSDSSVFALNVIDTWAYTEGLHFANVDGTYVLDLLGKTGEPRPDRPVNLSIKHRDFSIPVEVSLRTNGDGRIELGELNDITRVHVTGPDVAEHAWFLVDDMHSYPRTIHGKAGQTIEIPYMGKQQKPTRAELSLLELRGETFVADRFDAISLNNGLLKLSELPPGDYELLLKRSRTRIRMRITEGKERHGYVLGKTRQLEVRENRPLQIASVDTTDAAVTVRLKNASKFARVHMFATRYHPAYAVYQHLGGVGHPEPCLVTSPVAESAYLAARNLGDELRYIIDRKYARKYPGNMLPRPGLLLNPWAYHETEEDLPELVEEEELTHNSLHGRSSMVRQGGGSAGSGGNNVLANLDFLAQGSAVLVNLVPDEKGLVKIPREQLGPHQQIHVVAVDPRNTVYRAVSLPEIKSRPRDLRLADGLDPAAHYTQRKQVSVLNKGDNLELTDAGSSSLEIYDCLPKLHALFTTLSDDPALAEFAFILNWHQMADDEKRAKYSKYACHELSFFVYKKDPKFFQEVVQPYLRNKKDKTFLDHRLLDDDLTAYLTPWAHGQLNTVEQVLLAQRIAGQQPHTSRNVNDLFDLIPPDAERRTRLFDTAIRLSALDAVDRSKRDSPPSKEGKMAAMTWTDGRARPQSRADSDNAELSSEEDPFGGVGAAPAPSGSDPFGDGSDDDDPFGGDSEKRLERGERKAISAEEKEKELAAFDKTREALAEKLVDRDAGLLRSRGGEETTYFDSDGDRRNAAEQLYQVLDQTQQWLENNYYQLPIDGQGAALVTVNAFWRDYADTPPGKPFLSAHLAEATGNFSEMMFALALLDLPFEPTEHETKVDGAKTALIAGGPMVVFHQEIEPAEAAADKIPILVSQDFFRHDSRYRNMEYEYADKVITDEFLVHTVYGCQVVVTNPTSFRQRLDLLLQVPVGSIPVWGGRFTRTVPVDLAAYHTQTVKYYFYFPAAGEFAHYPVQVAKDERLIASAEPFTFHVVDRPTQVDRESWDYVSQHGTDDQVLAFLRNHNVYRLDLDKVAFRMADKAFFQALTRQLATRHVYHPALWSYGLRHNVVPAIREYLRHADEFVDGCGQWLDSPLLTVDPVARKAYQHVEFSPLVNARAHQLGRRRQIANDKLSAQYHDLLTILSYRPELNDDDLMSVTYYLLLQDRIEEALDFFGRVNPQNLETQLQYDYFAAYLDFYTEDHKRARQIANRYAQHPVDRWRNAFAQIAAQLDEAEGRVPQITDAENRTQAQTKRAASQPSLDFRVEAREISLNYQNLDRVTVNYYLMDIEMLFSQNPFEQQHSGRFSHIRPIATETVELPADKTSFTLPLPEQFHNRNVLVEIVGGGQTKSQASYSHSMSVQVLDNYGQVRVTRADAGQPLPKLYVKVYARMRDGEVRFYKDGYTDLRGRFDYTSLSSGELEFVDKFALLILSDEHGAAVKEADPPVR